MTMTEEADTRTDAYAEESDETTNNNTMTEEEPREHHQRAQGEDRERSHRSRAHLLQGDAADQGQDQGDVLVREGGQDSGHG
eukprot:13709437-Heterocapsa_arctica.AAC.1